MSHELLTGPDFSFFVSEKKFNLNTLPVDSSFKIR